MKISRFIELKKYKFRTNCQFGSKEYHLVSVVRVCKNYTCSLDSCYALISRSKIFRFTDFMDSGPGDFRSWESSQTLPAPFWPV